jgi:hypothetical protein
MEKIWEFLKKNKYEIVGICVWVFLSFIILWFFRNDTNFKGILFLIILGFPTSLFFTILLFLSFGAGVGNTILNDIINFMGFFLPIILNGYIIGKILKKIISKKKEKKNVNK